MVNLFIFVRAVVPRYKYMQLIKMCWTVFIPFLLFYISVCLFYFAESMDIELENEEKTLAYKEFMKRYAPITEEEVLFYERYRLLPKDGISNMWMDERYAYLDD